MGRQRSSGGTIVSEENKTASPERVSRKPFAVATAKGKVASLQTLSQFAMKGAAEGSRVLSEQEDKFKDTYADEGLVEPKYPPDQLKHLLYLNTYHSRACKTKARDVAGGEWQIIDRDPAARKDAEMQPEVPEPPAKPKPDPAMPEVLAVGATETDDPFATEQPKAVPTTDPNHPRGGKKRASPSSPYDAEHKALKEQIEDYEEPISETLYKVWLDFESMGFGAFEIVREGNDPKGQITDLVHIPSETIRKHRSGKKYKQKIGNNEVWYKDVTLKSELDYETGLILKQDGKGLDETLMGPEDKPKSVEDEAIARGGKDQPGFADSWLRGLGDLDEDDKRATEVVWLEQPDGVPDIVPAIPALYGDQSREEYNISFFENYGVPSMMLLITGDYDPGKEDEHGVTEMEHFLEERLSELIESPFSNLVVSIPTTQQIGQDGVPAVSITAVPMSPQVNDASFRLYRQDNRDEVLTANQVDPYRAQVIVMGQLGGGTAEESTEIYKSSTLTPKQSMLEHRLNRYVIRDQNSNQNSKIEFSRLDNRDSTREIEIAATLFSNGAITPNELIENFREVFDLGDAVDHPAMDLHYLGGKAIDSDEEEDPAADDMIAQVQAMLAEASGLGPVDPLAPEEEQAGPNLPGGPFPTDPISGQPMIPNGKVGNQKTAPTDDGMGF